MNTPIKNKTLVALEKVGAVATMPHRSLLRHLPVITISTKFFAIYLNKRQLTVNYC